MRQSDSPILRDIVLLGGGHSHVVVLHQFAMQPIPGVRITLICRDTHTPYSGMLPGYIAGHYSYDDVHIDLGRLAEFAGARFFRDEATGLDLASRQVLCRGRPPVPYDQLSINIGSTPQVSDVPGAAGNAIPVKPINQFNNRWMALLSRIQEQPGATRIAVVGGGAGGVELTLAMQYRLRRELQAQGRDPDALDFHLFTASAQVLPTHNRRARRAFETQLSQRGIHLHASSRVTRVEGERLMADTGEQLDADEIVWVTQAGGAAWLRDTGLELDERGFIRVRDTLQTLTDDRVFAAGDIATAVNHPREKAGVFAVRQGPPLARNLRLSVQGKAPRPFTPQKTWLALISTGDRHAVASRGAIGFAGDWVWRWKDWIDRRFMQRFSDLPAMDDDSGDPGRGLALENDEAVQAISALAMRCGGCGAKVGASVLSRALARLQPVQRDDVLIGLHDPDDAAVLRVPPGKALVQTIDFFRAFIDDPYVFGRIAANHALGDIFAMGAEAWSATAVATVPPGLDDKTEDTVFQMMSGALTVLNAANCALVGGHTGEGRELALGFAVNGLADANGDRVLRKSGMRAGDVLLLTKPIGTGTLLAAHARLAARGRWIDAALNAMCQSSDKAARCLLEHGATACTDVTGFGLLGHLLEMTRASAVDASLDLAALPVLDGAEETVNRGILSSLQPANLGLQQQLHNREDTQGHPRYPLLFDPQTAGGLLASVPASHAEACVLALRELGYAQAAIIGRVLEPSAGGQPVTLAT
ncbi:MAG: selenide, water dikinase SelD [Chromatocurvus sp.]